MRWRGLVLLTALAPLLAAQPAAADARTGSRIVIDAPLDDDLYAAAGDIVIGSAVAGSAVLAAGSIAISGDVEADALLAAGRVSIAGGIGDDLRAAGGEVTLEGFVTDQATIAGGTVSILPGSAIGGRSWIAAGTLELDGQVGGDVRIFARSVVISGRIAGDVEVTAREIYVAPSAVIAGDLVWRSEQEPAIAEEARIFGDVSGMRGPRAPGSRSRSATPGIAAGVAVGLAALLLWWLLPTLISRSAAGFRSAPGRTLLLGAAGLLLAPVAAFILAATIFGWILALLLMSGYLFALVLAALLGVLIVAAGFRERLFGPVSSGAGGWRSIMLLAAVVAVLVAAQGVPVLGALLNLLLLLAGFGALIALLTGRWSRPASP